jgi:KDO2-lipid IV(A) lauroyltransferase
MTMLFILYRIGTFIALHTPLRFSYWLASTVSSLYFLCSKKDRYAVETNLRVLFPDYDKDKIFAMARKVFVNFGKYLVDFFRFSKIDKDYIDKYVKIEGLENLKSALSEKKGVVAVSAHLGNWELGGIVIAVLGFPFTAVVLDHKDNRINTFFVRQREMKGVEVIGIGATLRRCFSALHENRVLALVGDRDYYDSGLAMDFFGKETIIPKGPAVFSRRFGSPIVPCFLTRNEDDTFIFRFSTPIKPDHTREEHQDLINTTKRFVSVLEKAIRQHPTQWCVFREFWKKISWSRK